MDIEIVSASFLALIPVVVGIVEVAKRAGLNVKYAPIVAIATGVLGCFLLGGTWAEVLLAGVIVGLSSSGLYSGTRTMVK